MATREVIFFCRIEQLAPYLSVAAVPLAESDANFPPLSILQVPFPRFSGPTGTAFPEAAFWTFAVFPLLNHANGGD
jgi:hypothetical protein